MRKCTWCKFRIDDEQEGCDPEHGEHIWISDSQQVWLEFYNAARCYPSDWVWALIEFPELPKSIDEDEEWQYAPRIPRYSRDAVVIKIGPVLYDATYYEYDIHGSLETIKVFKYEDDVVSPKKIECWKYRND